MHFCILPFIMRENKYKANKRRRAYRGAWQRLDTFTQLDSKVHKRSTHRIKMRHLNRDARYSEICALHNDPWVYCGLLTFWLRQCIDAGETLNMPPRFAKSSFILIHLSVHLRPCSFIDIKTKGINTFRIVNITSSRKISN